MPRTARLAPGGIIHHVLNRGVGKTKLFRSQKDYAAFHRCLIEAQQIVPIQVLGFCVMPNHWHLLLWPQADGELARFMMWLTNTHVRRWLTAHQQVGSGHLYQGRYKSFAIQDDEHFWTVDRYIARNALRAKMVERAQDWAWSSVGQPSLAADLQVPLAPPPEPRQAGWLEWVNQPQTADEEAAIVQCIRQGRPYGDERWKRRTMQSLGWSEPRRPGRPRTRRGRKAKKSAAVPV